MLWAGIVSTGVILSITPNCAKNVQEPPHYEPDIQVAPTNLDFEVLLNGRVDTTLTIANTGNVTLEVSSITDSQLWLSETPNNLDISSESSGDVAVTVDASGLSAGDYEGTITIQSDDPDEGEVVVSINLTVQPESEPEPDITVIPDSLSLSLLEGGTVDTVITVSNGGEDTLHVTSISDDANWLSETPANFEVIPGSDRNVMVTVDASGISAGNYDGTITMQSDDPDEGQVTVQVDLIVYSLVDMVSIPGGTFQMGSESEWPYSDEQPVHQVAISAFSMAKFEVTNEEMREVMQWAYDNAKVNVTSSTVTNAEGDSQELLDLDDGDCEFSFSGGIFTVENGKANHPCIEVTWYGGQAFCNYLSDMEGLERCISFSDWSCNFSVGGYRLPTEAEWEYACRAGTTTDYYNGDQTESGCEYDPNLDAIGWYCYNADWTEEVGQKQGNNWQLYDMSGNVCEWCNDRYGLYSSEAQTDPTGPGTGSERVVRGGSWYDAAGYCRSADRRFDYPDLSDDYFGFRPVRR